MTMTADLRQQALTVAGRLDPEVMSGEQALAAVEDLAVADKATMGALLFAALCVAKTNAWRGRGCKTPEEWLSATAGISVAEARRQLGTARKADGLGKTKAAMKEGKVSPGQADAITDAATADPSAEDDLLDLAGRDTHKNLREEAARRKAAATDDAARERRIRRERSKRSWVDRDGAFHLHLRGPAEDGARIEALVRPYEEQVFRTGRSDGVRDSFENRAYDAFLAALGLGPAAPGAAGNPSAAATEPASEGAATGPVEPAMPVPAAVKLPGGQNTKVIVRIDHTALVRGRTVAGETCEVAGLGPVSVEAVRGLMEDAFVAAVVTKGRDVVNVAHLGRGPNAYQRTALEAVGFACQNIGCNRTVNIQVDHRVPYADDPVTKLDNLDPLCTGNGGCHDLKTHHGHALEPGTGRRRLLPPHHPDHPKQPPVCRRRARPNAPHRTTRPLLSCEVDPSNGEHDPGRAHRRAPVRSDGGPCAPLDRAVAGRHAPRGRQATGLPSDHVRTWGRRIGWVTLSVIILCGLWTGVAFALLGGGHPSVIRVVGDGDELLAFTSERVAMQGVDVVWWKSRDGGSTWQYDRSGFDSTGGDAQELACTQAACYRLVDGVRIERQAPAGTGPWQIEHERPEGSAPPPAGAARSDWVEERSIAVASGSGFDAAVVAAGHDGALVRRADGTWRTVAVGHSWVGGLRWWVAGLGWAALLATGVTVLAVWFLTDRSRIRDQAAFGHLPPPPTPR